MSAFGGKADIAQTGLDVRFWHKADIAIVLNDVRFSDEMMHAALDINMPNYGGAIVSTEEIVATIAGASSNSDRTAVTGR